MIRRTDAIPVAALAVLAVGAALPLSAPLIAVAVVFLVAAVFAAVHHAEVVAHRVGEPFGTLVLALAVTVIEVSLILSMMLAALTFVVSAVTLGSGKTNMMQGAIHLVLFAAFLFLSLVP
jgi:Ca2+/H+ antiporter